MDHEASNHSALSLAMNLANAPGSEGELYCETLVPTLSWSASIVSATCNFCWDQRIFLALNWTQQRTSNNQSINNKEHLQNIASVSIALQ